MPTPTPTPNDRLGDLLASLIRSHLKSTINDYPYLPPEYNKAREQTSIVNNWMDTLRDNGRLAEICAALVLHHRNMMNRTTEEAAIPSPTPRMDMARELAKPPTPVDPQSCSNCHCSRKTDYSLHGIHAWPLECRRHCDTDRRVSKDHWCGDWREAGIKP